MQDYTPHIIHANIRSVIKDSDATAEKYSYSDFKTAVLYLTTTKEKSIIGMYSDVPRHINQNGLPQSESEFSDIECSDANVRRILDMVPHIFDRYHSTPNCTLEEDILLGSVKRQICRVADCNGQNDHLKLLSYMPLVTAGHYIMKGKVDSVKEKENGEITCTIVELIMSIYVKQIPQEDYAAEMGSVPVYPYYMYHKSGNKVSEGSSESVSVRSSVKITGKQMRARSSSRSRSPYKVSLSSNKRTYLDKFWRSKRTTEPKNDEPAQKDPAEQETGGE
ncbi:matrix protein [alfalfa-associated nucleorhabdovirus]|uniref:Matrix protein n=1 Tax=alfalfa-associated nucleorhabdovirus TaxID=2518374 RepID=A0A451G5G7_9RHAB|nr:matrix protein [alfalfa-associated nucleorhabdovirus]QAB45073.1 matrix protein [alfalfa-associated nucleorhabdovirus]UBX89817.1 matrix protein [alfalfa-associated nucleorhabdovirus]